jgi:hypothetical protein
MGLDMFMSARRHLSTYDANETVQTARTALAEVMQQLGAPVDSAVNDVTVEVAYWRKANAIHNWMVANVQNGDDDCREYYFSPKAMQELLSVCEAVLENLGEAGELLPPTSGFFFGSTDIDEYYLREVKYTRDRLTECLKRDAGWSFYYSSSW